MTKAKTKTDNAEFIELINRLKAMYNSWELPHIFLDQKLNSLDGPVKINDLAELAKRTFLAVHANKGGLNPNDPRFSSKAFRNIALHAIAVLQHKLIELFQRRKNDSGYMLLVSSTDVRWSKWREGMEEFIESKESEKI